MSLTKFRFPLMLSFALVSGVFFAGNAAEAAPTVEQALGLAPIQSAIDFDKPTGEELAKCTIKSEKSDEGSGWVVRGANGQLMRRFLDTNGDNKVDSWCYYKNGLEIYRDVDGNFNGKADQYRWLGTAGIRWGIDRDEDGQIDSWRLISAEEVSLELVESLKTADSQRFAALLITPGELDALGMNAEKTKELRTKIETAAASFKATVLRKQPLEAKAQWMSFGASKPGVLPANTDGLKRDLIVYENVVAIVEQDGKHQQVQIGTLVQVGQSWRLIDVPQVLVEVADSSASRGGFFFQAALSRRPDLEPMPMGGVTPEMQKLIAQLETLDKGLAAAATPVEQGKLQAQRADVLEALAKASTTEESRYSWYRQMADTIATATQSGAYAEGPKRLQLLLGELKEASAPQDAQAYVKFRLLTAEYGLSLQNSKADFSKIQEKWLKDLETFVGDFPKSADASEAMLQLAVAEEFAGHEEKALAWYSRIVDDFPAVGLAKKAAGAKRRLASVGKELNLAGTTFAGRPFDVTSLHGKYVVIHYWATWCEPCKQDMVALKKLQAKYGADLALVGICLDSDKAQAEAFLKTTPLPWIQLYEAGGLDSRLATELGVVTLPTMLLLDSKGKVINRNLHGGEADDELGKVIK